MTATKQSRSIIDLFVDATSSISWGTIDDFTDAVRQNEELVSLMLPEDVQLQMLKIRTRQMLKQTRAADEHALFASVKKKDEDGNQVTLYKQETLFDLSDYEQVVDYHGKRAIHHAQEAVYYQRKCMAKFGEQILLPFDETAILLD